MISDLFKLVTIVLLCSIITACLASKRQPASDQRKIVHPPADNAPKAEVPPTSLPLKEAPIPYLPHDGLFIRKNNEFGSQYLTGFKEQIEQGEWADQRNIRWDDFIASNSDQIPAPIGKTGLFVSYGISPIPSGSKHDNRATHYLEIALKAPSKIADNREPAQKPSANYVFVIDTSSSMKGKKLDMVKSAVAKLFMEMRKTDVIGVIAFSNKPRTILKATSISDIQLEEFSERLSGLTAEGGTDIDTALSYGFEEISRYGNRLSNVNQIVLFSDGNPTSGETNWIQIRQNIAKKAKNNTKLSLFAFGTDANLRELNALAGVTGGTYTFVTQADDVHFALNEELIRRDQVVALNVQMQIVIQPEIDIVHLYGHDLVTELAKKADVLDEVTRTEQRITREYPLVPIQEDVVTKEKGIRIFVPNLSVGETYWVVFELAIPEWNRLSNYGNAIVQYMDTFAIDNHESNIALNLEGKIPASVVVEHGTGLWTSEVIFDAIDDLYKGEFNAFKNRIENHIQVLEALASDLDSSYMIDDKIVLGKFMTLAENLGKPDASSDEVQQSETMQSLNAFGRLRNGLVQR